MKKSNPQLAEGTCSKLCLKFLACGRDARVAESGGLESCTTQGSEVPKPHIDVYPYLACAKILCVFY